MEPPSQIMLLDIEQSAIILQNEASHLLVNYCKPTLMTNERTLTITITVRWVSPPTINCLIIRQVSVDIIDVLGDIIEELRLVHTLRSDTQIESDTKEFVQDEWHKVCHIYLIIHVYTCFIACNLTVYSVS